MKIKTGNQQRKPMKPKEGSLKMSTKPKKIPSHVL